MNAVLDSHNRLHSSSTLAGLPAVHSGAELCVVVPTFNERDNVAELLQKLKDALGHRSWEVIFVDDDSPDGTAERVCELAAADARVRCIRRIGRRGLSSACVEGMLATAAPYLAVIDADMQHDERLLPQMLDALKQGDLDIVVGSRYATGGTVTDWDPKRARLSQLAGRLSRVLITAELTDPMSGFFMLRRSVFNGSVRGLSAIGFKILTDLFASAPEPLRFKEFPYRFKLRKAGKSKLDSLVAWEYAMLLLDKLFGGLVPVRFLAFMIVGVLGVVVHFTVLTLLFEPFKRPFIEAHAIATVCAMTFNYSVNNVLTYFDRRQRGWRWLRGWASFILACSIGGLGNVGVAAFMFRTERGWVPAALAGIVVGAVWNYAVTKNVTWGGGEK